MATYVFIDQNIPLVYTVETGVITKGSREGREVLFQEREGS
jgi:tetrahydromethanopterin S-methyltransferase subunit B